MKHSISTAIIAVAINFGGSASAQDVTIGLEILYLDTFANHGTDGTGSSWFSGTEGTPAYRLTGEIDWDGAADIRARIFTFDADTVDPDDIFKLESLDIEAVFDNRAGSWDLEGFAGLRAARIDWSDEAGSDGFGYEGVGPTIGMTIGNDFGNGLSFVATGRYSALFGTTTETASPDDTANGVMVPAMDFQLGLEYARDIGEGRNFNVGGGVEAQTYMSLSGNVDNDIDPEDVDLTAAGIYLQGTLEF